MYKPLKNEFHKSSALFSQLVLSGTKRNVNALTFADFRAAVNCHCGGKRQKNVVTSGFGDF